MRTKKLTEPLIGHQFACAMCQLSDDGEILSPAQPKNGRNLHEYLNDFSTVMRKIVVEADMQNISHLGISRNGHGK